MNKFKKLTIVVLLAGASFFTGESLFAVDPPPPPPASGGQSGHNLGGNQGGPTGAPIENGVDILLLLAAGFGVYTLYKTRKKTEQSDLTAEE